MPITVKSPREIELMAEAGRILSQVHQELGKALHPGMSTLDIDRLGEDKDVSLPSLIIMAIRHLSVYH